MTNQEIKTVGQTIAQETQIGGNTAARVGGVVEGIGVALDNKDAANGYYQATISGGTITVNAPNYLLGSGGNLRIKMPSAGTTASTLTIGNANAVQLWYNGAAVSAQNTWEADEIISVFYDGTRFMASNSQGGGGKAEKIKYDNSQSGLAADDVQGALDEVAQNITVGEEIISITFTPIASRFYTIDGNIVSLNSGSNTNFKCAPIIDVTQYVRVGLKFYLTSNLTASTCFADENGNVIGGRKYNTSSDAVEFIVPSGAKKLYLSTRSASQSAFSAYGVTKNGVKEELEQVNQDIIGLNAKIEEVKLFNEQKEKDYDLVINDENNYSIVKFKDGHIKTKNFDSRNISIEFALNFIKNKYAGKRCAIVGDSISTFSGTSPSSYANFYPGSYGLTLGQIWWRIVCKVLEMTYTNCSWSGSKVTGAPKASASAGCSDQRITDIGRNGDPDIIIFFIGCNDWGHNISLGSWTVDSDIVDDSEYTASQTISGFKAAYSLMLYKAQTKYPNAKLFCCTILDDAQRDNVGGYPSKNSGNVSTNTWNNNIKEIATAMGISVIDMHACGLNYANIHNYVVDSGLHPNAAGHALMANKVISELISK